MICSFRSLGIGVERLFLLYLFSGARIFPLAMDSCTYCMYTTAKLCGHRILLAFSALADNMDFRFYTPW